MQRFYKSILAVILTVTMLVPATGLAEPLKTEIFYSRNYEAGLPENLYELYDVLRLEVSNIISFEGNKVTVQNSTEVKVVKEAGYAVLEGFKITQEEMEKCLTAFPTTSKILVNEEIYLLMHM